MRPAFLWSILAVIVTAALAAVAQKATVPATPPTVDVLDDGKPIDLWFRKVGDKKKGYSLQADFAVSYLNRGTSLVNVSVFVVAVGSGKTVATATVNQDSGLQASSPAAHPYTLTVDGEALPSAAQLVVRFGANDSYTFLTRPIRGSLIDPPEFLWIVVAPIVLALITVTAGYSRRNIGSASSDEPPIKWTDEMGGAEWDFKSSWASNITIIGAIITTVLAFGALPNVTQHLARPMYESINLLWTLSITLAPAIYSFFRRQVKDLGDTLQAKAPPVYHGFVGGFIGSCVFTLWAVFGQLLTLAFLLDELEPVHLLPRFGVWTFWVLLALVGAGVIFYGYRTIIETLEFQLAAKGAREQLKQGVIDKADNLDESTTPLVAYKRLAETLRRPVWHPL